MGNIITFIAGCGGAGKTTAVINFGVLLAAHGRRVLLVDGAAGLPDLDASLGLERNIRYTLNDVICGRCTAVEALVKVPKTSRIWVLPASPTGSLADYQPSLGIICRNLAPEFDHILVDAPPGNEVGLLAAATAATVHVVVAQHTAQQRRGVEAVLALLRENRLLHDHPLVLFNRATPLRAAAAGVGKTDLLLGWGLEDGDVIGSIPEDEAAISAKHNGVPLLVAAPDSHAGKAFVVAGKELLERLDSMAGEESQVMEGSDDVPCSQA